MKTIIKLFGLERTGTNYIEWLIRNNFHDTVIFTNQLGWKHGIVSAPFLKLLSHGAGDLSNAEHKVLFRHRSFHDMSYRDQAQRLLLANRLVLVIMVKDPYSWYASLARYKHFPLKPIRVDEIRRWNQNNNDWSMLCDRYPNSSMIVRYEDLLFAFRAVLLRLRSAFSLTMADEVLDISARINPGMNLTDQCFDRSYYTQKSFLCGYSALNLESINNALDSKLMDKLGYSFIREPTGFEGPRQITKLEDLGPTVC